MAEDTTGLYIGQLATDKPHSFLVDLAIRLVKEKPLGTVGALIVLMLLIVGIFAHWIAPWGYEDGFWTTGASRLEPMSWDYWLGADQLGRDVLSRIIWGARISMFVGLGVSILSTLISGFIGVISGYLGGKADLVIQRLVDSWMAFPDILILITLMALVGPGIPQVIVVLGILYGITGSRTIRAATIGIKSNVYLEAARAIGAPTRTILWKHVLPNIMAPLIIVFTSRMGAAILAEASISFLGYGIPEPFPSWGGMINQGRRYFNEALHLAIWPGIALVIVVWGINMFGDAIRDLLDPRLRGGLGRHFGTKKQVSKQLAKLAKREQVEQ